MFTVSHVCERVAKGQRWYATRSTRLCCRCPSKHLSRLTAPCASQPRNDDDDDDRPKKTKKKEPRDYEEDEGDRPRKVEKKKKKHGDKHSPIE